MEPRHELGWCSGSGSLVRIAHPNQMGHLFFPVFKGYSDAQYKDDLRVQGDHNAQAETYWVNALYKKLKDKGKINQVLDKDLCWKFIRTTWFVFTPDRIQISTMLKNSLGELISRVISFRVWGGGVYPMGTLYQYC